MNPFTQHTRQQGVTYVEHAVFALGIAGRLLLSVVMFAVHAVLPFLGIDRRFDLEATAAFLQERNEWIESRKYQPRKMQNRLGRAMPTMREHGSNTNRLKIITGL